MNVKQFDYLNGRAVLTFISNRALVVSKQGLIDRFGQALDLTRRIFELHAKYEFLAEVGHFIGSENFPDDEIYFIINASDLESRRPIVVNKKDRYPRPFVESLLKKCKMSFEEFMKIYIDEYAIKPLEK